MWMDCLAAIGVSALAGRVFPAEVPGRRVRSQKGASWQARRCQEQRMQTLRTVQVCCPSPPGLPVCDQQRVMPQEQRGRLPMLAGLGAGWARGAPPAAAQLPTACGEIRVCGSQAGSSALLTGKGDEAETMTAGCEKLEPFGLGRRAVSCRPQWLFAPALPPGTRLPPPNRPAAGRRQA